MGQNSHIDFGLHDDIEDLVAEGLLENDTAAYGVAQQVIHAGYDALSEKQRYVYDSVITPALKQLYDEREHNRTLLSNHE